MENGESYPKLSSYTFHLYPKLTPLLSPYSVSSDYLQSVFSMLPGKCWLIFLKIKTTTTTKKKSNNKPNYDPHHERKCRGYMWILIVDPVQPAKSYDVSLLYISVFCSIQWCYKQMAKARKSVGTRRGISEYLHQLTFSWRNKKNIRAQLFKANDVVS